MEKLKIIIIVEGKPNNQEKNSNNKIFKHRTWNVIRKYIKIKKKTMAAWLSIFANIFFLLQINIICCTNYSDWSYFLNKA